MNQIFDNIKKKPPQKEKKRDTMALLDRSWAHNDPPSSQSFPDDREPFSTKGAVRCTLGG